MGDNVLPDIHMSLYNVIPLKNSHDIAKLNDDLLKQN